ncbi:hypothetical protein CVM73_35495 [Bradyrhizobium forestalis]|uniref:Uncharacterized protein n=1 Tax=Bradyrhizobium forestalis TaxID=1419263 RepID=A0A2M8QYH5_9BRAD|nr:hypothetical protein CVM73_35495 [Bradyrhizobium forestalis]
MVDLDLKRFFDRVNHDISLFAARLTDKKAVVQARHDRQPGSHRSTFWSRCPVQLTTAML